MVRLVLNNQIEQSPYRKVILNLSSGTCLINDKEEMDLNQFKQLDFSHPLLSEPALTLVDGVYCYSYEDMAGLLRFPKYVYSTLIQSDRPKSCLFKITATDSVYRLKNHYKIPFSFDYHRPAKSDISIVQLNRIVSALGGLTFHFLDSTIINQDFSYEDLPEEVVADYFYNNFPDIIKFMTEPDQFHKYELRYINRLVGFGVFAREDIKKNELVMMYNGEKCSKKPKMNAYHFAPSEDSLKMGTDALFMGNIGRFVNHAPSIKRDADNKTNADFLKSNLISVLWSIQGLEFIIYKATRDITKNEQLLVDYGERYFTERKLMYFNAKGESLDLNNRLVKENLNQKIPMLKIMAESGVKGAIFVLYKKVIFTAVCFSLVCLYLNYKF